MVYGHTFNGVTIRMGRYITGVLDDLKDFVNNNWDGIGLITGYEGDGKTHFGLNCAYYLDPELTIDNVAFNAAQFEEIIDRAKPGTCVVWDEADEIVASNWASIMVQTLKRKFKRIRSHGLFIILITPTMFDLGKYFVIHRTRFLFDVYADPKRDSDGVFQPNRGRVRFFNREKKRELYIKGVKEWNMKAAMPNFIDSFTKLPSNFPIDMSKDGAYESKKEEAFRMVEAERKELSSTAGKGYNRMKYVERLEIWLSSNLNHKISNNDLAWIFEVDSRTIERDKAKIRQLYAKEGGDVLVSATQKGQDSLRDSQRDDDVVVGGGLQ